jgi:hypothetical protein
LDIPPPPIPGWAPPTVGEGAATLLSAPDREVYARLARTVAQGARVESGDVASAEDLRARYPADAAVAAILERVLGSASRQALAEGRTTDAGRLMAQATELLPGSPSVWPPLIAFLTGAHEWRAAELAARRGISALPEDAYLNRALATALMRQNRNEEAADVLRRALGRREDPGVRQLLARLERELDSSAGMTQLGSAHFHVTFQGARDDALGEALVRVLEDKYRMLAGVFRHEPKHQIPVVLYPMQAFRGVSGAPGWAGASYSHFDGRIRIGTRDLTAGFVPLDLERTLTHELVHAFVASLSRGQATRDINEGLAQYHSGARLGYRMARSRTRTVDGRITVDNFYDGALSFVEYLLDRHGQSSMNHLLESMGKMDTDQAFRRAFGQNYEATREEWLRQLE